MEIVLLISVIIILIINNSSLSKKIKELNTLLFVLSKKIEGLSNGEKVVEKDPQKSPIITPIQTPSEHEPSKEEIGIFSNPKPKVVETIKPETEAEKEKSKTAAHSSWEAQAFQSKPTSESKSSDNTEKKKTNDPPRPSFWEKNPDIEKFVGENLVNKIGIAILVLGIGFFVKYAIDQNWINEIARVGIGLLCGGILLGIAHKLRNSFKAFSSVLIGGGIVVFYFTIAIAFQEYHIIGQTVAFIIMVLITVFAVLLSLIYDRMELAILSILGGFSTPFIISTGDGNYVVLFTYLCILNVGMLVLAYYKKWNPINIISYVLTILIFGTWMSSKGLTMANPPYGGILFFASIFYVIFFLMNIVNNVMSQRKFNSIEISILISNTFLYYSVGMTVLNHLGEGNYQGLFTLIIGVINFLFAYALYKNEKADRNLIYLLIGLVMTFISLAGPVQLEGNYITLFWAAEAVLLLWLSIKSGIKVMAYASIVITILMMISLIMDWVNLYGTYSQGLSIILNKGFITGSLVVASMFITRHFLAQAKEIGLFHVTQSSESIRFVSAYISELKFDVNAYRNVLAAAVLLTTYIIGLLEFNFQLDQRIGYYPLRSVILASYHLAFILGIHLLRSKKENKYLLEVSVAISVLGMLSYILFYNARIIELREEFIMNSPGYLWGFFYHYIDLILLLVISYLVVDILRKGKSILLSEKSIIFSALSVYLLIVSSMELDHIVACMADRKGMMLDYIMGQNHKIGFPILWGVYAFGLMMIGMKYKIKHLRIVALAILLVTLLKLFVYDIRDVSEGGKILAFICLGILLLIISFMYQRLKKLIIDDGKSTD